MTEDLEARGEIASRFETLESASFVRYPARLLEPFPSTLLPFHLNRKPGTVRPLANVYCIERDNVKKSHDKRAGISIEKFCFQVDERGRSCVPRGILRFEPMYIVPCWQTS